MKRWIVLLCLLVAASVYGALLYGCTGGATPGLTEQPAAPEFAGEVLRSAAGAPSGVRLSWPVVNDDTVTGYHVYKDQQAIPDSARGNGSMWVSFGGNTLVPQPDSAVTTVVADDLFAATIGDTWYYRIAAVDGEGSESRLSGEVAVAISDFSITSLAPLSAAVNAGMTVNGEYFGIYDSDNDSVAYAGVNWVNGIGFQPAPIIAVVDAWTPSAIATRVPLGATSGNVSVEVGGANKVSADIFTNSDPYLSAIDRLSGTARMEVTLTGNNFGDNYDTGHRVVVGTTQLVNPGDYVAYSNTAITFRIPSVAVGSQRVTVRVGTVDSNSAWLTVQQSIGPVWEHTWGESGSDVATGVVVDSLGDVYLGGFSNSFNTPQFDALLVKYSAGGGWQWSRAWNNTDQPLIANRNENAEDICIDNLNNLYLTGTVMEPAVKQAVLVLKYDMTGSFLWARYWSAAKLNACNGTAITCDGSNVYIAGIASETDDDILLLKYNVNGTFDSSAIWTLGGDQRPNDIIVDDNGDLIITGYTTDAFGASGLDSFVLKVDEDFTLLWADYWGGLGEDQGCGLYTDNAGNVFVAGGSSSWGVDVQPTLAVYNPSGVLSESYYLPLTNFSKFISIGQAANGHFYCVGTGSPIVDVLYVATLDTASADFALLSLQGYTHALTTPKALGGWQTASDDLFVCGMADRRGATWFDQPAVTTVMTPQTLAESLTLGDPNGVSGNLFGTVTNAIGIENTGGGGDDALIIKYNPE